MKDFKTPLFINVNKPKKSTMKYYLKGFWLNIRSLVYSGLTLGGILIVVLGSIVLLPVVLVIIVGAIVFFIYKLGMYDNEEDT